MRKTLPLLTLLLALPAASARASDPAFTSLGTLGTNSLSLATAISDDGKTVVGGSGNDAALALAFRWTAAGGMVGLGSNFRTAYGVSADGSVIVGNSSSYSGYRWTSASTVTLSGNVSDLYSLGVGGISPNGALTLGIQSTQRYIPPTPGFGQFPGTPGRYEYQSYPLGWSASGAIVGTPGGVSSAASYDASVLVGSSTSGSITSGFRNRAGVNTLLPQLSGWANGQAFDVSADGAVVVGRAYVNGIGERATLWDATGAVRDLGDLPGGTDDACANAVSPDGRVVVGQGTTADGKRAFIWTRETGTRDLRDVLSASGLAGQLAGWTLTTATDVTVDATGTAIVVGTGIDPLGRQRAFVTAVPEPASMLALSLGALALLRRRRKA